MIAYTFKLDDGTKFSFVVDLQRHGATQARGIEPAPWTRLDFHQCTNCPLKPEDFTHCPAALDVQEIAERFKDMLSYTSLTVEVETPQRTYSKRCDAQTGLTSLLGVVMATSTCPILSQLKDMAYFHLPFASVDETLLRTVGIYLIKQYLRCQDQEVTDITLSDLGLLYQQLCTLNTYFQHRIRAASERDANLNALGALADMSMWVTMSLEDQTEELKALFADKTKKSLPPRLPGHVSPPTAPPRPR